VRAARCGWRRGRCRCWSCGRRCGRGGQRARRGSRQRVPVLDMPLAPARVRQRFPHRLLERIRRLVAHAQPVEAKAFTLRTLARSIEPRVHALLDRHVALPVLRQPRRLGRRQLAPIDATVGQRLGRHAQRVQRGHLVRRGVEHIAAAHFAHHAIGVGQAGEVGVALRNRSRGEQRECDAEQPGPGSVNHGERLQRGACSRHDGLLSSFKAWARLACAPRPSLCPLPRRPAASGTPARRRSRRSAPGIRPAAW
jgi:hypothetical protein